MKLNEFAAEARKSIYEDLLRGVQPSRGTFDASKLHDLAQLGAPQHGPTRFEPSHLKFEFIYGSGAEGTAVFTVSVDAPERIVFMPVPGWVIESIWQGDIDGSFHFESDARALLAEYEAQLASGANDIWFAPRPAKRRE